MPRYGFIREKSEVKFLILFVMSFLPIAVTESSLLDICLIDGGFGYFEFAEAFRELIGTGHVSEIADGKSHLYVITEKGRYAAKVFEHDLPSPVREKAQSAAVRVVREIKRNAAISTSVDKHSDNNYTVNLSMRDSGDTVLSLSLMVVTPQQGAMLERNFRKYAEKIYNEIITSLLKERDIDEDPFSR